MKKLVVTTIIGIAASLSCFAQGNFTFNSSAASLVWDNRTGVGIKAGPTMEVAVLWSSDTNAVPTRYLSSGSPTNGVGQSANWAGIFTDPNFHLALDFLTGTNIVSTAGGNSPFQGVYSGGIKTIQGAGEAQKIAMYVIAWERSYGIDPIAAANAPVPSAMGFSQVIVYQLGTSIVPGAVLVLPVSAPLVSIRFRNRRRSRCWVLAQPVC
jgi:hypothetical protein